jgi:hypothetical protein
MRWQVAGSLSFLILGCGRSRDKLETYLLNLEGGVDRAITSTIGACSPPPNARDGLAISTASSVSDAYRALLEETASCLERDACVEVEAGPDSKEAGRRVPDGDRARIQSSRDEMAKLLGGKLAPDVRQQLVIAARAGIEATVSAKKLLDICAKPHLVANQGTATATVERARGRFRDEVKKLRAP